MELYDILILALCHGDDTHKKKQITEYVAKGEIPIEKNVIVTDQNGNVIGATYPKRAKGLLKNGRAAAVSDGIICLNTLCPPEKLEDKEMTNRLFFNAREWSFNKTCAKNVGERCFINGIDGKLIEVYSIGNWQWDWTEIISKPMVLEKNTEYCFCFWLNGGENDSNTEVCQLRVVFDDNHEDCLIYKLNRGYIKPVKRYNGWELYDIAFTTGDNEQTQLKFSAMMAYMAVQPAKEPQDYDGLDDNVDEFSDIRPQRHNIIFEDGWPTNKWYSTKDLRKNNIKPPFGPDFGKNFGPDFGSNFGANFWSKTGANGNNQNGSGTKGNEDEAFSKVINDIKERVRVNIMDEIDIDDIVDEIADEIDIDDIMEDIKGQVDIDSLRNEIRKEVFKHMK